MISEREWVERLFEVRMEPDKLLIMVTNRRAELSRATQSAPSVGSVDLFIAQKAYIDLLSRRLDSSAAYLAMHGWKTPQEDIDEGARLRNQIALLTERQGGKD